MNVLSQDDDEVADCLLRKAVELQQLILAKITELREQDDDDPQKPSLAGLEDMLLETGRLVQRARRRINANIVGQDEPHLATLDRAQSQR